MNDKSENESQYECSLYIEGDTDDVLMLFDGQSIKSKVIDLLKSNTTSDDASVIFESEPVINNIDRRLSSCELFFKSPRILSGKELSQLTTDQNASKLTIILDYINENDSVFGVVYDSNNLMFKIGDGEDAWLADCDDADTYETNDVVCLDILKNFRATSLVDDQVISPSC